MKRQRIFSHHPGIVHLRAEDKTAEILIYDEIGEGWYGGLGSKDLVQQLAALGDVDTINVRINSPGGDVFEGVAIYNALKAHKATVNVQIDSLAASIATVIAMAGDTVKIAPMAMMMVHNPSAYVYGEAKDLRKTADLLDKVRDIQMVTAYARTGMSSEELTAIMDEETWYSAQEAVDSGWVDGFTEDPPQMAEARSRYDLSAFKHPPKLDSELQPCPTAEQVEAEKAAAEAQALVRARLRREQLRLAEL